MLNYIKKIYSYFYIKVINSIQRIEKILPVRKNIVFECESDMDDNPRAVYEYLIEQGYNKKHKMIWIVKNVDLCKKLYGNKNVVFLNRYDNTYKNQIKLNYYLSTAKWFIFSHPYWFKKIKEEQVVIHIGHGSGIKNVDQINTNISYGYDWLLVTSEHIVDKKLKFWNGTMEKVFFCGHPRVDFFEKGEKNQLLNQLFDWKEDEKVIICMPTYKQSTRVSDSNINDRFSIIFIKSEKELVDLNNELSVRKTHLIVKLHPLQRKDLLCVENLSNIHYVTNDELFRKKIMLYELIGKCDALITDLSSVYNEYLLLNRPIAFLMENIRNYKRGYLYDNIEKYMPGKQIENYDDFISFINNLASEKDKYEEDRKRVFEFFHSSNSDNNCAVFCNWMFEK